jgi:hypothetical protein
MPSIGLAVLRAPDHLLRFDEHQFARRAKAVSTRTEISFGDYNRMHVVGTGTFRRTRWCPEFINNDSQLRRVLATAVWQSVNGGKVPMPAGLETNLEELKRLSELRLQNWESRSIKGFPETERRIVRRHCFNLRRAGGFLQLFASVVYLSWKLGQTSPDVAEQLWLAPCNVRIIRYRLCQIARKLGFETFVRHKTVGIEKGIAKRRRLWREANKRYRERLKRRRCK